MWDTGDSFVGVEKMICENFLSRLFFGKTKTLYPVVGDIFTMPVRKNILGLLNTVTSSQVKHLSSTRGSTEQTRAVTGGGGFSNADHLWTLNEERRDGKEYWDVAYESILKSLVSDIKGTDNILLLRSKSTGAWLSVRGTTVSGTVLSATEFRDFLCTRYNVSPVNLQSHCGRCGTALEVAHTLNCSIGGLVITRH